MARTPLSERPRDLVYFLFFAIHLPATFLIDLQALYPTQWVPGFISSLPKFYVEMSSDPLIGSAMGYFGRDQQEAYTWFRTFLLVEAFFQVPVFVTGLRGLWKGSRSIYVLLLIYAASTTTTTLPCLSVILSTPISPTPLNTSAFAAEASKTLSLSLTAEQRLLLLSSYIPFFLVPLVMTIDMGLRVQGLLSSSRDAPKTTKQE
ncbi:transmembrane protein 6/97 [Trametes polyzona]|nr:transmembrane protein 6/97 [Trametes polyzona]